MKNTYKTLFLVVALLFISFITNAQSRIWGVTLEGGISSFGTIYSTSLDGTDYNVEYKFDVSDITTSDFARPNSNLTFASDGNFYGLARKFRASDQYYTNQCVLYKYDPRTKTASKIKDIIDAENWITTTPDKNHLLFATNSGGGKSVGAIMRYTIDGDGSVFTLRSFTNTVGGDYIHGYNMETMPTFNGNTMYGTCHDSKETNSDYGILFSLDDIYSNHPSVSVLDKFSSSNNDGRWHKDIIHQEINGIEYLFWTTSSGGANGDGTIYRHRISDGTSTILHSFNEHTTSGNNPGWKPYGGVIFHNNLLYGTTYKGGTTDGGVAYRINTDGSEYKTVHQFSEGFSRVEYRGPGRGLFETSTGKLIGTVKYGEGGIDGGMLYELRTNTTYQAAVVLKEFDTATSGKNPYFQLMETCAATSISINWPRGVTSYPKFDKQCQFTKDILKIGTGKGAKHLTATNNCGEIINWTSKTSFPITTQGVHKVTLTFDDGKGNVATTNFTVSIEDDQAPVPNITDLWDLHDTCEEDYPWTYPTADDNCSGTITATTTTTFPITTVGETIITWNYTDNNGNSSFQTQKVTIGMNDGITVSGSLLSSDHTTDATYQWQTDKGGSQLLPWRNISGATSRTYEATEAASYRVVLTSSNGGCNLNSQEIKITNDNLGIENLESVFGIKVFPNPTNGLLKLERSSVDNIHVQVIDMSGRLILTTQSNNTNIDINLLDQPAGIYNLIVTDGVKSSSIRIIKK